MKFLLIFFITFSAFSQGLKDCGKRVYLPKPNWGKQFLSTPVLDQGTSGLCYAFTATQMLDYWRETNTPKLKRGRLSLSPPLYAGYLDRLYNFNVLNKGDASKLDFGMNSLDWQLDGGMIQVTLLAIKKYGMCRPEIFDVGLKELGKKLGLSKFDVFFIIQSLWMKRISYFANFNSPYGDKVRDSQGTFFEFVKLLQEKKSGGGQTSGPPGLRRRSPRLNFKEVTSVLVVNKENWSYSCKSGKKYIHECEVFTSFFDEMVSALKETNFNFRNPKGNPFITFLGKFFKACDDPRNQYFYSKKIPNPVYINYETKPWGPFNKPWQARYNQIVDFLNNKNAQPVGIGYCANVITNKNYRYKPKDYRCERHASVILGKRKRNGKCEFFLRNTWGNTCDKIPWECSSNPKYPQGHGYWVDGEALARNLQELVYLRPR
ncbi:MAG: hypothetical protein DRQ88_04025 [Epsilonproteobacteria bacterium]|nr:MAG: hypothetical protein DRQ89_04330 [Campylobacterota bacterium]RLA67202.1 MAG: hypothetical protein DRQ88_04025 [Campylobacterota bacterium]